MMTRPYSQVLLVLTLLALLVSAFADKVHACDMSMHKNMAAGSATLGAHKAINHQDMSAHNMAMTQTNHADMADCHQEQTDGTAQAKLKDCCDTDCSCQHGTCSNLLFVHALTEPAADFHSVSERQYFSFLLQSAERNALYRPPIC